jgi:formate dehydrogenase subunit gamma
VVSLPVFDHSHLESGRNVHTPEPWNVDRALDIIAELKDCEGPMLPILHAMQEAFGQVPEAAAPLIAEELNLSRAEVHGVITFYHDFRREPAGRHVLKLCRAEACQSCGCDDLIKHAQARLGVELGDTTADGRFTIEAVYCLGLCSTAPSAMLDGKLVGRLNAKKLDRMIAEAGR